MPPPVHLDRHKFPCLERAFLCIFPPWWANGLLFIRYCGCHDQWRALYRRSNVGHWQRLVAEKLSSIYLVQIPPVGWRKCEAISRSPDRFKPIWQSPCGPFLALSSGDAAWEHPNDAKSMSGGIARCGRIIQCGLLNLSWACP